MSFNANYFLAGQSKIHKVKVELSNSTLTITDGIEVLGSYSIKDCQFSTIIARIPVEVRLPDKGRLEIENTPALLQNIHDLQILKHYSPYYLENKFKYFIVGLVLTVVIFFASFKYIIPAMSRQVATVVPSKVAVFVDNRIKDQLDRFIFSESKTDSSVKLKLTNYFKNTGLAKIKINYRKGGSAQANAFALAGENIFFTDEIIELMDNDRYLLAIAFHEAGHLEHRHVLSTIIKDSFVFLLTLIYLGDLPGAADNLMQMGLVLYSHDHSREFEKEADEYAIKQLIKHKLSPKCFTEGMNRLHKHYEESSLKKKKDKLDVEGKKEEPGASEKNNKEDSFVNKYKIDEKVEKVGKTLSKILSTHPSLKERTTDILKKYPKAKECGGSKVIVKLKKSK